MACHSDNKDVIEHKWTDLVMTTLDFLDCDVRTAGFDEVLTIVVVVGLCADIAAVCVLHPPPQWVETVSSSSSSPGLGQPHERGSGQWHLSV